MTTDTLTAEHRISESDQALLRGNLLMLNARYPNLATRLRTDLNQRRPRIYTEDGSSQIAAQMQQQSENLTNFSKPVLLVGLYPGDELLYLFNLKKQCGASHGTQHIYVCINSLPALSNFMSESDLTEILSSDRVHLFWHETPEVAIDDLAKHPERLSTPTVISGAQSYIVDRTLAHFSQFSHRLAAETKRLIAENNTYYDAISDDELANAFSHERRPARLMLLTSSCSTVTQYSARDTSHAFTGMGWETQHLNFESNLPAYYVAKRINEFKPDVFLFINHLRTEATAAYPKNMMFITWIQDTLASVNNRAAAEAWNHVAAQRNRDLIVGYTAQLKPYGYLEDRLKPLSMIVNTELFRPHELTPQQIETYGCDVMFASNSGMPTERRVKEVLTPLFKEHGLDEATLMDYHDRLWRYYRSGNTITNYQQLIKFLKLDASPEDEVVQLLFWRLNDAIYRHVVIEWLDEYAQDHPDFTLHLYGNGWDEHPRFGKYARGVVEHGVELSVAYQAASYCLHLNSSEGGHQRLLEARTSGGTVLSRRERIVDANAALIHKFLKRTASLLPYSLDDEDVPLLNDLFWPRLRRAVLSEHEAPPPAKDELLCRLLGTLPDCLDPYTFVHDECSDFCDRAQLAQQLDQTHSANDGLAELLRQRCAHTTWRQMHTAIDDLLDAKHEDRERRSTAAKVPLVWPDANATIRLALLVNNVKTERELVAQYDRLRFPGQMQTLQLVHHFASFCAGTKAGELFDTVNRNELSDDQLLEYANAAARLGKIELAESVVETAYQRQPHLNNGYASIAWQRYVPDDWAFENVTPYFERDIEHNRLAGGWALNYATALASSGRDSEAFEWVQERYAQDASLRNGYADIAFQKWQMGDRVESVLALFKKDEELGRLSGARRINSAYACAKSGNMAEALMLVESAYANSSVAMNGYVGIGFYGLASKGDYSGCLDLFEQDRSSGRLCGGWKCVPARVWAMQGELDRALAQVKRIYQGDDTIRCAGLIAGLCACRNEMDFGMLKACAEADLSHGRLSVSRAEYLYAVFCYGAGDHVLAEKFAQKALKRTEYAAAYGWGLVRFISLLDRKLVDKYIADSEGWFDV
jgi:hypothetical protein